LFFLSSHIINAQYVVPDKFIRLSFEVKSKEDKYTVFNNGNEVSNAYSITPEKNYAIALGINIYRNLILELAYEKQIFEMGLKINNIPPASLSSKFEQARLLPIRLSFEYVFFKGKRIPISLTPTVGYIFVSGNGGVNLIGDAVDTLRGEYNGMNFMATSSRLKGVNYDIHRTFGLGEIRMIIEPHITDNISMFLTAGFCYGVKVIGEREVLATVNGIPQDVSGFKSKGSNRYLSLGLKYKIRLKS
jgi:hypothetical protein